MIFEKINFDSQGLVPAILQDYKTHKVLMFAFMNKEALQKTISDGLATFYSRSRKKIWQKGESSGDLQKVHKIFLDCDNDCLLLFVESINNKVCHTGRESCFYKEIKHNDLIEIE